MIEFREDIKSPLVKAFGTILKSYEQVRITDQYGWDAVDRVIFQAACQLDDRYGNIFDLLYYCIEKNQLLDLLAERGRKKPLQPKTIDRYISYAKNRVVELVLGSPQLREQLQAAVEFPRGENVPN